MARWGKLLLGLLLAWTCRVAHAESAPVVYRGRTLFEVKTRFGPYPPAQRAKLIEGRVEALLSDPFRHLPSLQSVSEDGVCDVFCDGTLLFSVTEADAQAEGMTLPALTAQRMATVDAVVLDARWSTRLLRMVRVLAWALGMVVVGGSLIVLWIRGLRRLALRLASLPADRIPALRIQQLELVSREQVRGLALGGLRALRWLGTLGLLATLAPVLLSLFPHTQGLSLHLGHSVWALVSQALNRLLGYLPSLGFLVLIVLATRGLLRLIHRLFAGLRSGALSWSGFLPEWADPTYSLVRILVLIFALVVAFPYLPGAGSEAFKGVSIFVGVIFSLGSSGLVGNAMAGILITYMRPFRIGDRITVGETTGDVVEKSFLVTRVRTIKNVDVTIPNSTLLGAQVHNFSANAQAQGLILHSTVTIGYDAPWRVVHGLLLEAAAHTEGLLADPAPFVLQTSLDDFFVSYQINAYTRLPNRMAELQSNLHTQIQEAFNRAGVEIMSPHYRAVRDGNPSTIPVDDPGAGMTNARNEG